MNRFSLLSMCDVKCLGVVVICSMCLSGAIVGMNDPYGSHDLNTGADSISSISDCGLLPNIGGDVSAAQQDTLSILARIEELNRQQQIQLQERYEAQISELRREIAFLRMNQAAEDARHHESVEQHNTAIEQHNANMLEEQQAQTRELERMRILAEEEQARKAMEEAQAAQQRLAVEQRRAELNARLQQVRRAITNLRAFLRPNGARTPVFSEQGALEAIGQARERVRRAKLRIPKLEMEERQLLAELSSLH